MVHRCAWGTSLLGEGDKSQPHPIQAFTGCPPICTRPSGHTVPTPWLLADKVCVYACVMCALCCGLHVYMCCVCVHVYMCMHVYMCCVCVCLLCVHAYGWVYTHMCCVVCMCEHIVYMCVCVHTCLLFSCDRKVPPATILP